LDGEFFNHEIHEPHESSEREFNSLRFQFGTLKTGRGHGNLKSEIGNLALSEAWCPPPQPEKPRRRIGFNQDV